MGSEDLIALIVAQFPTATRRANTDRPSVSATLEELVPLLRQLHDDERFAFDLLVTHTAIDYPSENRIELLYVLYSTTHGHWLVASAFLDRTHPVVPSITTIWPIAEWHEREAFDMFGILYENHPDLRRVFLDDDWKGHPLRKDYQDEYMLELPK